MSTPNSPTDPDQHPGIATTAESETAKEEEGGGFGYGLLRVLVAAPGLIVAKFTSDLIPFVPAWAEYLLLGIVSFALGNVLISVLVAIGKRADRLSAEARAESEAKADDS